MPSARRVRATRPDEENHYWISFSDLMSALLVIFVLAVVALALQLGQQQASLQAQQDEFSEQVSVLRESEVKREEMLLEIQQDLESQGIEVIVSENNSVISIPSELLGFDKGSYDINDEYKNVSLAIGTAVANALAKDDRMQYIDTVFVEGHTDNARFTGLEGTGNWGLSTFRAISLWRLWEAELPAEKRLGDLVGPEGQPLFSVSGYAETRPVNADQSTDENRAVNRRIDIRFTVVRPEAQELEKIEEGFSEEDLTS